MNKDGRKVIATAKPGRKLRPGFVLTRLCMAYALSYMSVKRVFLSGSLIIGEILSKFAG